MEKRISRTMFCPCCYRKERPRTDTLFVVYGSHGYHVYKAKHIGKFGFTPHIIEHVKAVGDNVFYRYLCGINQCGVSMEVDTNGKYRSVVNHDRWQSGKMSQKDWQALLQYKHDNDYEI